MPNTLISQQSKNLSGVLPYLKHPDSNQYSDSGAVSKKSINQQKEKYVYVRNIKTIISEYSDRRSNYRRDQE
jgi:hypothetical protein